MVVVGGEVSSMGREGEGSAGEGEGAVTGAGSRGGAQWDAASRHAVEEERGLRGREAGSGGPAVK